MCGKGLALVLQAFKEIRMCIDMFLCIYTYEYVQYTTAQCALVHGLIGPRRIPLTLLHARMRARMHYSC